jgi:uncharacterized damage-inducible protein DinB
VFTARELSDALIRTITGPMWHGPALAEVLKGVSREQASERPISSAHTIAELVAHITTWADVPRQRLAGQARLDVGTAEDWPTVPATSDAAWRDAVARMESSYRALARDVAALDEKALDAKVPGHDYTVRVMLHGVIEHGTYHGGQIALLRKALG